MRIVKKLSNKEFTEMEIGKSILIVGLVKSFEEGEGTYGPYVAFKGMFGAEYEKILNGVSTVEKIRSGVMYVPDVMANMLVGMVEEGWAKNGDAYNGTEFAFRLLKQADPDERNARKYKWAVETVVEPAEATDPVSRIMMTYSKPADPVVGTEEALLDHVDTPKTSKKK